MNEHMRDLKAQAVPTIDTDVCIKRIYEKPVRRDGYRVLVDRLWPRGIKKENAALDEWLRDIAPSTELREWFAHEPGRWSVFRDRYLTELGTHAPLLDALHERATQQRVTLLYAARDKKMNHAVVLEEAIRTRSARSAAVKPSSAVKHGNADAD